VTGWRCCSAGVMRRMNDRTRPEGGLGDAGGRSDTTLNPHEPSAWLRGQVARRVAYVRAAGLDPAGDTLMVAPLGRPASPGAREDRTCDRCRSYTPVGPPFYTFGVRAAKGLLLCGGMCRKCWAKEVAR
jgi:hypothetical protein